MSNKSVGIKNKNNNVITADKTNSDNGQVKLKRGKLKNKIIKAFRNRSFVGYKIDFNSFIYFNSKKGENS